MFQSTLLPACEGYFDQKSLCNVSDDEFINNCRNEKKVTAAERVLQAITFIIGFGWLRLALLLIVLSIYIMILSPMLLLAYFPQCLPVLKPVGFLISRVFIRICLFCLGVLWIRVEGKCDKKARVLVYNHQSLLDGPSLWFFEPFTVIVMSEMLKVPFFGRILIGADSVFIDRKRQTGASALITNRINDVGKMKVAVSPEGKTTKGKFLLKFHTGSFLTEKPIQPVALSYSHYMCWGGSGVTWLVGGFIEWLWECLSCPLCIMNIKYLETQQGEEFNKLTPREKADKCQLMIANTLGVKASNRSNTELPEIEKKYKRD